MPVYPPPAWNLSGNNWYVGFKLATPLGLMQDIIALQPNASGIGGNALYAINQGAALPQPSLGNQQGVPIPGQGVLRSNADTAATLGYVALPGTFSGSYLNTFSSGAPYHPLPSWPTYFIGFNVGLRQGGYLGCNLSIAYFPGGGQQVSQFWQQDISYCRVWYISEWTYFTAPGNVKFLPDWYALQPQGQPTSGPPIWCSSFSPSYGSLYQCIMPAPNQFIAPNNIYPPYQQQWNDWIAAYAANYNGPQNYTYKYTWAFMGDVFQASPYLPWQYGIDVNGLPLYTFSYQPQGVRSNCFGIPSPLFSPLYGQSVCYDVNDHPFEKAYGANYYGFCNAGFTPAWVGSDWLYNTGIGVGLGCTLYFLYASQNLEYYFF